MDQPEPAPAAAPTIEVRLCGPDDWPTVVRVDELAFGYTFQGDPADAAETAVFEIDRTFLATLDGEPGGITSAFSLRMTVPGGAELPVAGVTWVGVVPTMRRRGLLTALMSAQLAEVHDRGEPVAALFASEAAIYGRFGYGVASQKASLTVTHGNTALRSPADASLRARIVPVADAQEAVGEVFDAVRARRPGVPARDDRWWRRTTDDSPGRREGASELRALLVGDGTTTRAYALFSSVERWEHDSSQSAVRVREAQSSDAAASGVLWSTLFAIDLVRTVHVQRLAVDDPLLHQLVDLRRARVERADGLHVRLVDLPAALLARDYTTGWEGVVAVSDAQLPANTGRWRLRLGPGDAAVERTDAEPDLSLGVAELGAAYLGAGELVARAAAGFVQEHTPGAVAGLSAAMRWEPAPFSPFSF